MMRSSFLLKKKFVLFFILPNESYANEIRPYRAGCSCICDWDASAVIDRPVMPWPNRMAPRSDRLLSRHTVPCESFASPVRDRRRPSACGTESRTCDRRWRTDWTRRQQASGTGSDKRKRRPRNELRAGIECSCTSLKARNVRLTWKCNDKFNQIFKKIKN
jgi:hypothetical protein